MPTKVSLKGGPGSGHHGHAGRPGQRGGSVSGGVAMSLRTGKAATGRKANKVSTFDVGTATKFDSIDDVIQYGDENWQFWADSLHPNAEQAFNTYAEGFGYGWINDSLRHPETELYDPEAVKTAEHMIRASMPLSDNMVVYRSFGKGDTAKRVATMQPGDEFTDAGFSSTSMLSSYWDEPHTTKILVPKGTRAAYLSGYSDRESLSEYPDDETELLLMPGQTFRMVGTEGGLTVLEVV
jgi:hypothetical protein